MSKPIIPWKSNSKYNAMKVDDLVKPINGHTDSYLDHWWLVTPEDEVLFFGRGLGSPRCNRNKNLVDRLAEFHFRDFGVRMEVRQIPLAYVPLNISDYT